MCGSVAEDAGAIVNPGMGHCLIRGACVLLVEARPTQSYATWEASIVG